MSRLLGKPGFCIVRDLDRPDPQIVRELARFPVAIVGDGMGRRGVMHQAIKPIDPRMRLCGPAVTIEVRAGDNLMIHAGLAVAQPGDVLVINAHGDTDAGLWGGLLTRSALKVGIAGVVIDGAIRDCAELIEMGLPVFTRGVCPCGGDKEGPGQVNRPIACGGVPVLPGDLVVGDGDGVIVVPADLASEAVRGAAAREEAEAKRVREIVAGVVHQNWLLPTLRKSGVLREGETL